MFWYRIFLSQRRSILLRMLSPVSKKPVSLSRVSFILFLMVGSVLVQVNLIAGQPPFTFTAPPVNATLTAGSSVTIQWTGGNPSWLVSISLNDVSAWTLATAVASGIPNNGQYAWTIPTTLPFNGPCGRQYQFYIEDTAKTTWTYGPTFTIVCGGTTTTLTCVNGTIDLNTGTTNPFVADAAGTPDPHWVVTNLPSGPVSQPPYSVVPPYDSWVGPIPTGTANWVSPYQTSPYSGPSGPYTYSITFTVSASSILQISGYAADNNVYLYYDNNPIPGAFDNSASGTAFTNLHTPITQTILGGTHTLSAGVDNNHPSDGPSPTGLIVIANVTCPCSSTITKTTTQTLPGSTVTTATYSTVSGTTVTNSTTLTFPGSTVTSTVTTVTASTITNSTTRVINATTITSTTTITTASAVTVSTTTYTIDGTTTTIATTYTYSIPTTSTTTITSPGSTTTIAVTYTYGGSTITTSTTIVLPGSTTTSTTTTQLFALA